MDRALAHQIWNYIGMLGVDRETASDLYQEAETAIWEAEVHRLDTNISPGRTYLVKTGIGAIRHWLRDYYALIRIPGYLHDRGEATEHMKTIFSLDEIRDDSSVANHPALGVEFEGDLVEGYDLADKRERVKQLLSRLTRAEREVMEALLADQSIRDIARKRGVRVGCVYAQRSRAIRKLRKLVINPDSPLAPRTPYPRRPSPRRQAAWQATLQKTLSAILQIASQHNGAGPDGPVAIDYLTGKIAVMIGKHRNTARQHLNAVAELYPGLTRISYTRWVIDPSAIKTGLH